MRKLFCLAVICLIFALTNDPSGLRRKDLSLPSVSAAKISDISNSKEKLSRRVLQREPASTSLKQASRLSSLKSAVQQAQYRVRHTCQAKNGTPAWHVSNPANRYEAYIQEQGVNLRAKDDSLSLSLKQIGYGGNLHSVYAGKISGKDQQVTIERNNGLTEWFYNSEAGLEHGFTLKNRLTDFSSFHRLRLVMEVSDGWQAETETNATGVLLTSKRNQAVIAYNKLLVLDANHQKLPAGFCIEAAQIVIEVDDSKATYPLTIDPVFTIQQELTASDGEANDRFGASVAISGDTAIVGATADNINSQVNRGSVYVFVRSGDSWTEQAKLTASDGVANDEFGSSVAIDGNTVIVGAPYAAAGSSLGGAAYVFVRSGTMWTEQAKLTASDGAASDVFGWSVSLSGETAVIGAYGATVGSNTGQGAAYVFVRSGTMWTQQTKLTASDGSASDEMGYSVAVSGNTAVIGADLHNVNSNTGQGAAYVFVRSGVTWSQQTKLTASDGAADDNFGNSVAISGETVIVGSYFDDINSNTDQGAAYIFVRSGIAWAQQAKLSAGDGATDDLFGSSVAISGEQVVIGSDLDDVGTNINQGSAYVFERNSTTWSQKSLLAPANGNALDNFGNSVGIAGGTIIAGAILDDAGTSVNQGSATVFIPCTYQLSPASRSFAAGSAASSVTLSCNSNVCDWTAVPSASWITITSAASGTGNATINYSLSANTGASRTSTITVNGSVHSIFQATSDLIQDTDNDGIPDSVEITEGTNPQIKDNDIFANTAQGYRLFVMQQYRDFLGREGDAGGIDGWVSLLSNGSLTRAQVVENFFNAPEFQNYVPPVVRLYFAAFNRIPDYGGLLFWIHAYRAGTSLETIAQAFVDSPEFQQTYGNLNNTQYVTLLYQNVLGRAPDPAGLAYWVGLLDSNTLTRGQVLLGFSESEEHQLRRSNDVFVVMMYVGMLRRTPEQAGFDGWVNYLNAGNSRLNLIQGFLDSPEYHNRFLP
jgi:hypothetical protein